MDSHMKSLTAISAFPIPESADAFLDRYASARFFVQRGNPAAQAGSALIVGPFKWVIAVLTTGYRSRL